MKLWLGTSAKMQHFCAAALRQNVLFIQIRIVVWYFSVYLEYTLLVKIKQSRANVSWWINLVGD